MVQQLMWLTETLGWPWMAHVSPRQNAASESGLVEVRLSLPLAPGLTWLHSCATVRPGGSYCMIVVPHTMFLSSSLSHTHVSVNYCLHCLVVSAHIRLSWQSLMCVQLISIQWIVSISVFLYFCMIFFTLLSISKMMSNTGKQVRSHWIA